MQKHLRNSNIRWFLLALIVFGLGMPVIRLFMAAQKTDDVREAVLRKVYSIRNVGESPAISQEREPIYVFYGQNFFDVSDAFLWRFHGSIPPVKTGQGESWGGFVFGEVRWINEDEAIVEGVSSEVCNKLRIGWNRYRVVRQNGKWNVLTIEKPLRRGSQV